MTERKEIDDINTYKKEYATKEFSNVVDATSEFLKKTFPYAYSFIEKLRGKSAKKGINSRHINKN